MKNTLYFTAIAALLLSMLIMAACNDEDDSYWCGCNDESDGDSDGENLENAEDIEYSEDAEIEISDADGDSDSADNGEGAENAAEEDIEAEPFIPADCIIDTACTHIMVASHRGYHEVYPDNTLAAVRAAFELGADFAEVDVLETADDVLVLSHEIGRASCRERV